MLLTCFLLFLLSIIFLLFLGLLLFEVLGRFCFVLLMLPGLGLLPWIIQSSTTQNLSYLVTCQYLQQKPNYCKLWTYMNYTALMPQAWSDIIHSFTTCLCQSHHHWLKHSGSGLLFIYDGQITLNEWSLIHPPCLQAQNLRFSTIRAAWVAGFIRARPSSRTRTPGPWVGRAKLEIRRKASLPWNPPGSSARHDAWPPTKWPKHTTKKRYLIATYCNLVTDLRGSPLD